MYDRTDDALAGQLGLECLRYMYRLLFLFYIEARPDLGYAPMDSETYLKGYSLEHLRDLELVRLTSEESLDGYYLHHAVQTLFALIRDGFDGSQRGGAADLLAAEPGAHLHHGFRIRALDSALFREGSTPLLDRVKLRNHVLQQVIRLMSLTRPAKGRRGRRGRISYAQLGINQLGAVYEALLSYRGFFAEEDLYEVKKAGEPDDPLKSAWFVPARDLDDYTEDERVYDKDDEGRRKLRVHPRGRFIYRLAGRDRQKTASYYTPESLTRCVVKYALRELVSDDMPADRILDLTVCEPAMGSAAFLNEAVNQLAEKYLERRQRELGRRIPHAEYADELQQVKHYIADRNVYGVDLNPVARELAEVSLWLNCIHQSGHVPWFGYQLVCGNSLVGARRQVFPAVTLGERNRKSELWFNHAPERVTPPSESSRRCTATNSSHVRDAAPTRAPKRPAGTVYHFLLPDPGMTAYSDKAAKALEPQCFERIAGWRKRFFKPFAEDEIAELEALSDRVDALWALHAEQLARDHRETEDALPVWGRRVPADERHTTNTWKDRIRNQGVFSQNTRTASPYRRLKLVMDYWCALWFWPIREAHKLPDRHEFLTKRRLAGADGVRLPARCRPRTDRRPLRRRVRRPRRGHREPHHRRDRHARPRQAVRAAAAAEVRRRPRATPPVPPLGARLRGPVLRRAGRRIPARRLRPGARQPAVDQGGVGRGRGAGGLQPAAGALRAHQSRRRGAERAGRCRGMRSVYPSRSSCRATTRRGRRFERSSVSGTCPNWARVTVFTWSCG